MNNRLLQVFQQHAFSKICILGFGREGKSTLQFLNQLPETTICIADKNAVMPEACIDSKHNIIFQTGEQYLDHLDAFDGVIKSPGVLLPAELEQALGNRLTSQTALFMEAYHQQMIGITGTKGKSTTSKLIEYLLQKNGQKAVLAGNIGIPPFSINDQIEPDSWIVYELSAHQLKNMEQSPHISVLLNIFSEHLDYFGDIDHYAAAKLHIGTFQNADDCLIMNVENENIQKYSSSLVLPGKLVPMTLQGSQNIHIQDHTLFLDSSAFWNEKDLKIKGSHNLLNAAFAIEAVHCCGIDYQSLMNVLPDFCPLEHRLEYVGCWQQKHYYNDSIATVPEATLAAIDAIGTVDTLILGGMDRGIDYSRLLERLMRGVVRHILFTGLAGERMLNTMKTMQASLPFDAFYSNDWELLLQHAVAVTSENGICLLSPAAASYGQFRDFEERGTFFKTGIRRLSEK
ncbi:MAG: UDP-N-acetylmuramoyl-L-alanine--D-glutamate ligase [Bacteroidales bacterium]|nr:UDP-N-acetylmuramoyl-L-alanine--D-glutamate ligase [Bacteroidales bacterium]